MHTSPDLLALLALGEDAGNSADLEHLTTCTRCRGELAGMSQVAQIGRLVRADDILLAPPPRVWDSLRRELGLTGVHQDGEVRPISALGALRAIPSIPRSPESPVSADDDTASTDRRNPDATADDQVSSRRGSRARRFLIVGIAAALALVAGFGAGVSWNRTAPSAAVVTSQMNALPRWRGSSGEATLERQSDGSHVLTITLQTSAPAPAVEEVWLSDSKAEEMMAIGKLTNGSGRFVIDANIDMSQHPVVDVSAEPPNDVDPNHSGNSIVRCRLRV